ncbi:condensin-2 complex subunit D3 [Chanos chanos]|uniref:Condensin-2 complex subunit D3 n=1 Tax=Chanos chanos TaxID=29144 RepID=A0A6J2WDM9_CHACN|nr:condensin-2 complex subunit D3 [Chanos chanos]
MDLIDALELLKIKDLSKEWVDLVWDFEFTDTEPLDAVIEENIKGNPSVFRKVYQQLSKFVRDDEEPTQNVWMVFGENEISAKSLVALLSYFILAAKTKTPSVEQRLYALQAASLYLLLLKIPGSVANKVFHQILFDICFDLVLRCWPGDTGKKRKKDSLKSSQADSKGGKRSKPPRKDSEEMEVDEDDTEEEEVYFSAQDLLNLREEIVSLVKTLLGLLEKFSLKDKPQSAENCVRLFTELTNFESAIGEISFSERQNIDKLKGLPELAYHGLQLLCSSNHGEGNECRRRVFHRLLYVILMMRKEDRSKPRLLVPSQSVYAARDQAISFINHIVDEQKENVLPLLRILLQHICYQMVEKSEYRSSGAQAVGKLVVKMPSEDYAAFIKWLYVYSLHTKVAFRMFALDVAMVLLEQPEREAEPSLPPELSVFLPHKFLVQSMIFGRRSDPSPTVRGHALHCLAQCLELPSHNATKCVQELFSTSTLRKSHGTKMAMTFRTIEVTAQNASFETQESMALVKRRVSDPKTNVRKCALQTLTGLLKHNVISCIPENLAILSDRCRDPAVSVKKKALQCLMDLLTARPESSLIQEAWLRGVVPAVMDTESSVQEKALECLDQMILAHIKHRSNYNHGDVSQTLAWDLLDLMSDQCQDLRRYLSKAFSVLSQQKKFASVFFNNLISHTDTQRVAGAWLLLSKIVGSAPKFNFGDLLDAWDDMIRSKNMSVTLSCHILAVFGDIAEHLNEDTKTRIVEDLLNWLKGFNLPLEVISASVDTLYRLGQRENVQETMDFMNRYCGELVSLCESYLSGVLLSEKGTDNLNVDLLVNHLYTLGVASLHCPAKVSKRVILLVQSVLTSSVQLQPEGSEEMPASQPLSQFKPSSLPTVVRAHAAVTLGKLCLQNEELMQKCLPALAQELEVGKELAVRSNVVVVMCDLCVRYTNTVTRYIPNISACLRDSEALIREQTLIMLTNLLQEEFVKWKGSLFFRFAAVLVDPDPDIAGLCEYCLVHLLLKKNPLMFSQHFIECIFHFNSYDKHKKYNKFSQTDSEKARFSLKGPQNQGKRFRIYKFLLKHFTDEQRFNIITKISQDVLACFVDGELPLDSDGAELLADTFDVLSLREIKLTAMSAPSGGEDPQEDEMAMAKAVIQVAQKKLISQVQKRNFIKNVIPIVIALKNMLEEQRSPVLKHLMAYLQVTMQDYRNEVREVLAADEQLATEVEYNLKMFEKEQQQQQQEEEEVQQKLGNCSLSTAEPASRTPTASVPVSPAPAGALRSQVGFATPLPPRSATRGLRTPKSSDLLRRRTFSGIVARERSGSETCTQGVGRAISTPQESINEVTFGEQVSAIYSERLSGRKSLDEDGSILHLMSPDHQASVPRKWNVESPMRRKARPGIISSLGNEIVASETNADMNTGKCDRLVHVTKADVEAKSGENVTMEWMLSPENSSSKTCQLERLYKRTGLTVHLQAYSDYLQQYKEALTTARSTYYSDLIHSGSNNPKALFSTINNLLKPTDNILKTFTVNNCNSFLSFFQTKIDTIYSNLTTSLALLSSQSASLQFATQPPSQFSSVSLMELANIMAGMKSSNCILDPIPSNFIKDCLPVLSSLITLIINSSFSSGSVPQMLKLAAVTPILEKPGLNPNIMCNFHPISITAATYSTLTNSPTKPQFAVVRSRLCALVAFVLYVLAVIVLSFFYYKNLKSFKFVGVHITEDLSWSLHVDTVVKKAHQQLFPERTEEVCYASIRTNLYMRTAERLLTGCIIGWYRNCSAHRCKSLLRVIAVAQHMTGSQPYTPTATCPVWEHHYYLPYSYWHCFYQYCFYQHCYCQHCSR